MPTLQMIPRKCLIYKCDEKVVYFCFDCHICICAQHAKRHDQQQCDIYKEEGLPGLYKGTGGNR